MKKKTALAKGFRILTVPPIMALLLIVALAGSRHDIFTTRLEVSILASLLGIVPALAYPWQKCVSRDSCTDREKQRNMAFVFTGVGYSAALTWAIVSRRNKFLIVICLTYFLSAVMLVVCNKLLHIRASGHMCGVTAPLLFLVWLIGWKTLPLCLLLSGVVVWSSLHLKRHTICELAIGCAVCVVSAAFSISVTTNFLSGIL